MDCGLYTSYATCDGYTKIRTLGKGTFGKVYLMEKGGNHFAMKVMNHFDNEEMKLRVLQNI